MIKRITYSFFRLLLLEPYSLIFLLGFMFFSVEITHFESRCLGDYDNITVPPVDRCQLNRQIGNVQSTFVVTADPMSNYSDQMLAPYDTTYHPGSLSVLIREYRQSKQYAFDTSIFDTLQLGDQITSDMLEEIKAFHAILSQPISLGLLVKGGQGPPGSRGPPGETGGRGTMGDEGPVGENGSTGLEGRFGLRGPAGPPGEPGTSRYGGTYGGTRGDRASYASEQANDVNSRQRNYEANKPLLGGTKIICEGGQLWIGCERDEKIEINNAFWGRDDFITCSQRAPSNTTRQYSLDNDIGHVLMKVKEVCNWHPTCEFFATRLFFDDVSDSQVYKYLRVEYDCVPEVHERQRREIVGNLLANNATLKTL